MNNWFESRQSLARRELLGRTSLGIGSAALGCLLGGKAASADTNGVSGLPHFAPKAKRVIYLMQSGAPSHVDLFDYKPMYLPSVVANRSRTQSIRTRNSPR